jgi:hypothetical protein
MIKNWTFRSIQKIRGGRAGIIYVPTKRIDMAPILIEAQAKRIPRVIRRLWRRNVSKPYPGADGSHGSFFFSMLTSNENANGKRILPIPERFVVHVVEILEKMEYYRSLASKDMIKRLK